VQTRPKPWKQSQPPTWKIGEPNISLGWIEGNFPQTGPRPGIARMAKSFIIVDDELYKCAATGILQRCIPIP
jgi:hypothetical protein